MNLTTMITAPSVVTAGVAALALVALAVWWLRRKRQRRVWLPTMRIMRLEPRVLPRLVLRLPPLIAFLCFLASTLALILFSFRPSSEVFTPFEPNQSRIHIFCDLSPSVAAYVTLDEYASQLSSLYESLQGSGRITLSTSHAQKVEQPENAQAAAQLIRGLGFQRAGVRLGSAIKALVNGGLEANRLIVVSDRDQHSWTDFNWRYLLEEMEVVFFDLARSRLGDVNFLINDARYLSSPASASSDWDVEILRRGSEDAGQGRLTATFMGQELTAVPWQMAAGKQRLTVRLTWPATMLAEVDASGARDVPIVFRLESEGQDAIAADNAFRSEVRGIKRDALIISESGGERPLEDPAQELSVSLAIQGFRVKRFDYVVDQGGDPAEFPLVVAVGGMGHDHFCPDALTPARLSRKSRRQGSEAKRPSGRQLPKVWLAPSRLNADYQQICSCFVDLQTPAEGSPLSPDICAKVHTREEWVALLPLLGAKQIGGTMGDVSKAVAFTRREPSSGLDVLAFTVPLMPLLATGVTHASMPIMVKELLQWQGLTEASTAASGSWPRVDDYAAAAWDGDAQRDTEQLARIRLSNVPIGESLMTDMEPVQLPPRWSAELGDAKRQLPAKKDREDPLPWLRAVAIVCVLAMLVEALFDLSGRLYRAFKRRPQLLLILLFVATYSQNASAKVELAMVTTQALRPSFAGLARELSQRTSIEIETKPLVFSQVSPETLAEPWLWVERPGLVATRQGILDPDVALWLKRGGFLIIEAPWQPAQLDTLVSRLDVRDAKAGDGWRALPPDHEIMRSFYLLDALPSCNGEIWRGYQFDGRLAILAIPYGFLQSVRDQAGAVACANPPDVERSTRIFINMIMVALATDYKRDQIHLPEILKRLR